MGKTMGETGRRVAEGAQVAGKMGSAAPVPGSEASGPGFTRKRAVSFTKPSLFHIKIIRRLHNGRFGSLRTRIYHNASCFVDHTIAFPY